MVSFLKYLLTIIFFYIPPTLFWSNQYICVSLSSFRCFYVSNMSFVIPLEREFSSIWILVNVSSMLLNRVKYSTISWKTRLDSSGYRYNIKSNSMHTYSSGFTYSNPYRSAIDYSTPILASSFPSINFDNISSGDFLLVSGPNFDYSATSISCLSFPIKTEHLASVSIWDTVVSTSHASCLFSTIISLSSLGKYRPMVGSIFDWGSAVVAYVSFAPLRS